MLPRTGPVSAPVSIHWNEHQIPFIEAENDADLAVALGMVHAHLRLAQMEIMRRAAQGRVAEFVGPLGIELDRSLRLLDFGRAVPDIIAGLATETRLWADGFVRGREPCAGASTYAPRRNAPARHRPRGLDAH